MIPYRIPFVDSDAADREITDENSGSVDPHADSTIDVAERFRFFFNTAFLMCAGQLCIGVFILFVRYKDNVLKQLLLFIFRVSGLAIILLWVYAFTVRYMHSGAECSGDLIVNKSKMHNLLYIEGMFIKFSSLLVFFICFLYIMGHILNCY